ncbi:MAG: DNA polymerase I [Planctomycetota bacterium]
MAERVVLVDGSALIFRAYYAIPANLRTSRGLPTNAIYGFANTFKKLWAARRPAYGAVVFDAPGPTFRDERYPQYKADRAPMGDDLVVQLPWIDRVVAAHRFPVLRVPGFEADDVIGTLCRLARAAGHEVVIVSSDKDFAQLVGEGVRMFDSIKDVTYDPELVRKKWGVAPERFVDFLALTGDKVDNVPGVPGIGKKGAAELLASYGDLDGVLAHTGELKGKRRQTLEEHAGQARLSRELVTIETAVPLEAGLADLALPEVSPESLNELYRELEFYSLLSGAAVEAAAATGERDYAALRDPAELGPLLAEAPGPVVWEPCLEGSRLVGLALCPRVGVARYLALCGPHAPPELAAYGLAAAPSWAPLREHLADPAQEKAAHDAKALWTGLRRLGVELRGVVFDTRLASFLLDPTKVIPHRLDQLAKEYLHRTVRELKGVVGSGKKQLPWAEAPLAAARDHACHLADAVRELVDALRPALADREGMPALLRDLDLPLSWVLGEMELQGVLVDVPVLEQLGREFRAELAGHERRIHELAGREFNVGSPKQLADVLFEDLGLEPIKRTKTGYSTDQEVLERLSKKHPIAESLLEHRSLAKLINTYTDVLQAAADPVSHRVHTTFMQTTSATGRLITTDPDLQRTPVRGERGARLREAFVAPPGHRLVSADWSQIELRLLADASEDEVLVAAFGERRDVHALTAGELFSVPPAQVTGEQRRVGKTVNFATIYGQGATALGQILDVPRKEAKRYIDGFFATYRGVAEWLEETTALALERGWVQTRLGRRRYIPELSSNNHMTRQAGLRMAANTPLQGSAADICKLAMLELERRLRGEGLAARMVLQIHDELLFEAPVAEVPRVRALAKEVMESVVELAVPLIADVGAGSSWAEAHA